MYAHAIGFVWDFCYIYNLPISYNNEISMVHVQTVHQVFQNKINRTVTIIFRDWWTGWACPGNSSLKKDRHEKNVLRKARWSETSLIYLWQEPVETTPGPGQEFSNQNTKKMKIVILDFTGAQVFVANYPSGIEDTETFIEELERCWWHLRISWSARRWGKNVLVLPDKRNT